MHIRHRKQHVSKQLCSNIQLSSKDGYLKKVPVVVMLLLLFVVVLLLFSCYSDRLVGLEVKASVSRAKDPGFESRWRRDFSGSSHTSDLNIDTPLDILPYALRQPAQALTL